MFPKTEFQFWKASAFAVIAASLAIMVVHQLGLTKREDMNIEIRKNSNFSFEKEIEDLAKSYFKSDWLTFGISKAEFDHIVEQTTDPHASRDASMIVQVIDGNIYVDQSKWKTAYAWDVLRSQFILDQLLKNTHDCPIRNFKGGPYFSITKCEGIHSIPLPQWYSWRDGSFFKWDALMDKHFFESTTVGWEEKESRAVFRGVLRPSSLRSEGGSLKFFNINTTNWKEASRSKLVLLARDHPDLLDVGITPDSRNTLQMTLLKEMGCSTSKRVSMLQQSQRYKYVVYMEGACGWADRLKNLLAAGFVIFLQETPCLEFFTPLLKPMVHYVPIKNDLSDLVDQIQWARAHDDEAREIACNAADFARTFLSQAAWETYFDRVFLLYSEIQRYPIVRNPGTLRYKKHTNCTPRKDHFCNTTDSFESL